MWKALLSEGLSCHYPARGRKLPYLTAQREYPHFHAITPQGDGNQYFGLVHLKTLNFHAITPQGDGNGIDSLLLSAAVLSFMPLPRKGTETYLASLSKVGASGSSSFMPLPRKGTETKNWLSTSCCSFSFMPLPRKGTETLASKKTDSLMRGYLSCHYPARGRNLGFSSSIGSN